ncbi:hypothetical protein D9M68_690340 [compost metagenome]
MGLVDHVSLGPAPGIALDALDDARGQVVVVDGDEVRLQQLQAEGHAAAVGETRRPAREQLAEHLAITEQRPPREMLGLDPVQFAGYLRCQPPTLPERA